MSPLGEEATWQGRRDASRWPCHPRHEEAPPRWSRPGGAKAKPLAEGYDMSRTITIDHGGTTYYGKVARITGTHLGGEDHGILSAYLHCEGDGWGISVGGFGLDKPVHVDGKFSHREPTAYGFDHVVQLYRTVGADSWEKVVGREVLVLFNSPSALGGTAAGIAHISDEKRVLILKAHAEKWLAREDEAVSA